MRWNADNDIYNAREATLAAGLSNVDVMSWWCDWGGGPVSGIAFVGTLCSDYNTNLNEYQATQNIAGLVSIANKPMLPCIPYYLSIKISVFTILPINKVYVNNSEIGFLMRFFHV